MNFKQFFLTSSVGFMMVISQSNADVPPQLATQNPQNGNQALQQLQQLQALAQQTQGRSGGQAPSSTQANEVPPANTQATNFNNMNGSNASASANTQTTAAVPNQQAQATSNEAGSTKDPAFESVISRLFPLSTDQVVKLHAMYNTSELAQATEPKTPPRPTATSQFVNLATGSTPPVIRLAQGFVSSLVFLDSTGSPWPIVSYDLGDPHSFNIAWDRAGNTLMIQSNKLYTYGNLAVRLQGLNTPVMLTLIPGQKAVDYRVDLRIQGYGPNASPTQSQSLPPSANSVLMNVLDGVPPPGSKLLDITGGPAEAWEKEDRLYLRTRLKVLSPGWISVMSSADGMSAYEMEKTPVLLAAWRGKVLQLRVEGL